MSIDPAELVATIAALAKRFTPEGPEDTSEGLEPLAATGTAVCFLAA